MNPQVTSIPEFLTKYTKVHRSLLTGQIILIALSFKFPDEHISFEGGVVIFPIFIALVIAGLYFQQRQALKKAKSTGNLSEKLTAYGSVLVMRYAMIEAPILFSLALNFISGEKVLVILSIGLTIYLFTQKPTQEKIVKELELTFQEEQELCKL